MSNVSSPFQIIKQAWSDGRPIVPLYGAGISIESGIPSTPELIRYFCRLKYLHDRILPEISGSSLIGTPRRPLGDRGLFVTHEWLDRFQLNADLLLLASEDKFRKLFPSSSDNEIFQHIETAVQEVYKSRDVNRIADFLQTLTNTEETQPEWKEAIGKIRLEWHEFLTAVTGGHQHRIDAFFDTVIRHKQPGRSHTYNAFLTQYLDIRTILTTNFDDLIETALTNHGISSVVVEIVKGGDIPPPELVNVNRAVVKLHGGVHGLRADESLNDEFSQFESSQVCRYIPTDALIVVLGYGGSDRRVMALLEALTDQTMRSIRGPRILWIYRTRPPESHPLMALEKRTPSRIENREYRDGGLFLQELYGFLTSSHPVSLMPYSILPQVSPPVPQSVTLATITDHDEYLLTVFHATSQKKGTSLRLAQLSERFANTHHIIWIDLEEFPSLNAMATVLYHEICRHDSGVIRIVLSPLVHTVSTGRREDGEVNPLAAQISDGLKRGRYLVAFDSLGEFCSDQVPADREREHQAFFAFLKHITGHLQQHRGLGDSRIVLAYSAESKESRLHGLFMEQHYELANNYGCAGSPSVNLVPIIDPIYSFENFREDIRATNESDEMHLHLDNFSSFDKYVAAYYSWLSSSPESVKCQILEIACFYRRPRSAIDLSNALRRKTKGKWLSMSRTRKTLSELEMAQLLVRRDGGFFWMHRLFRDRLRQLVLEARGENEIADIHECIALSYYRETFLPSRDIAVFLEYVYHRLQSTKTTKADAIINRYRALAETLDRESDYIFDAGHADLLLLWITQIKNQLKQQRDKLTTGDESELGKTYDLVLRRICELEASARRDVTDYEECIRLRRVQIQDRMRELEITMEMSSKTTEAEIQDVLDKYFGDRDDGSLERDEKELPAMLRLLEHVLDIGVCKKGLRDSDAEEWYNCAAKYVGKIIATCNSVTIRDNAHLILIKTYYRLTDLYLSYVDPWKTFPKTRRAKVFKKTKEWLDTAMIHCNAGLAALSAHPSLSVTAAARQRCYYNTIRARYSYLSAIFGGSSAEHDDHVENAARFLKRAQSALNRLRDPSGETALAVCELHRAESQVFQVKAWRERGDESRWKENSRNMLNRASLSLSRAQQKLTRTRRNVWWWTLFNLLTAQLYLELLYFSRQCGGITGADGRLMEAEPWGFECLCAIAAGRANILKDQVRKRRFMMIHRDLKKEMQRLPKYQDLQPDQFDQEWRRLNDRAGV